MRGFSRIVVAIAVFLCGFTGLPAMAQTTSHALDDTSLKTMLDGLGYDNKPLDKGFLITYKVDTWSLYIQVVLSPDKTKLGLNANLGQVDDLSAIPAKKWLGLLETNSKIDPSSFYVDEPTRKLYLHRVMDNRDLTPALLRVQFESFVNNITDNEAIWDLSN